MTIHRPDPVAAHLRGAILNALEVLMPGPCGLDACDGCREEWADAVAILEHALEPVSFVQVASGEWKQMQRVPR